MQKGGKKRPVRFEGNGLKNFFREIKGEEN